MANKFLHSITLTNGAVQSVTFDYLTEADLPHTLVNSFGFGNKAQPNDGGLLATNPFSTVISLEHDFTDLTNPNEVVGLVNFITFSPSGTVNANAIGVDIRARSTGSQNYPFLAVLYCEMDHYGTGTATELDAVSFVVRNHAAGNATLEQGVTISAFNDGTGTVADMRCLTLFASNNAAGTVNNLALLRILSVPAVGTNTNLDGIRIENETGAATFPYNFRSMGTTSKNLYEGQVMLALSGTTFNAAVQLEGDSTIQGWLPPRWTTAQKNAINSPPAGLVGYDVNQNRLAIRTPTEWEMAPANPGILAPYSGSGTPSGWLLCDGASYPTATYPDLFAAIGYGYGGSGANFKVPNLVGHTP